MMNMTLSSLTRLVLLAACVLAAPVVRAQDATTGAALYKKVFVTGVKSCESCHGTPREDPVMVRGADANRIRGAACHHAGLFGGQAVARAAALHAGHEHLGVQRLTGGRVLRPGGGRQQGWQGQAGEGPQQGRLHHAFSHGRFSAPAAQMASV